MNLDSNFGKWIYKNTGILIFILIIFLFILIFLYFYEKLSIPIILLPIIIAISIFLFSQFYIRPPYFEIIEIFNDGNTCISPPRARTIWMKIINSGYSDLVIKEISLGIIDAQPSTCNEENWQQASASIRMNTYEISLDPVDKTIIIDKDDPYDYKPQEMEKFIFSFFSLMDFQYTIFFEFYWFNKKRPQRIQKIKTKNFVLIFPRGQGRFYRERKSKIVKGKSRNDEENDTYFFPNMDSWGSVTNNE